jgi:hypothetical protein
MLRQRISLMNSVFAKKINEGGAVGHLYHLYDNRELTFGEIKGILQSASEGKLESVSEKLDGMNLVVSWDVQSGDLRVARSAGDIGRGGMDAEAIAQKFRGRGNVGDAFNSAFEVLKMAISIISDDDKLRIFGQQANIWYSAEVIYTANPNVINYDSDNIVFHGWPIFNVKDGKVQKSINSNGIETIQANIERMQEAVTAKNWKIRGPAILRMKSLSNGSTLQNATSAIDSAMSEAGVGDGETIGQYLENLMRDEVQKMDLDEQVEQMIVDRCLEKDNAPSLVQIKKIAPKENYEAISNFVKSSPVLLKKFIVPIEDSIHLFAIEALRGIHSTLISDSDSEVARLRSEVSKAIDAITSSGDEVAMEIIKRQMQKLKSLDNIASAMEGIVFIYNGNAYKFTASFAPVNQILGLFKYGRGSTKL